jgi:hypothetical protein
MRRALLVGINDYPTAPLQGCVNDASSMANLLEKHHGGSPNFDCKLLTSPRERIIRSTLREQMELLLKDDADVALFYFSGHGTINNLGGFLVTQDATRYDEGVAMTALITLANSSKVREIVMLLDCCHSGALGHLPEVDNASAVLREGVSILTASRASQVSMEVAGEGVFTSLLRAGLSGGASDVVGKVTIASLYAYVDQALGAWDQRPLFKAHVSKLVSLRTCEATVEHALLRLLPRYFPTPDFQFSLDPSYEPDAAPKHEEHERIFSHLQKYRSARLVVPIGEEHMYYAAMNSKACQLSPLGQFYWKLANGGKL